MTLNYRRPAVRRHFLYCCLLVMLLGGAVSLTTVEDKTAAASNAPVLPANSKIVFGSNRDGNNEIYVMDGDGSNQTRLTHNAVRDSQPAYSPDGSKIVFLSERDGNEEIYVMNADGTGQTNLSNNPSDDLTPSYSPDGGKIAFASFRDGALNSEIYAMNADGTGQTRLTNNPETDAQPAYGPDRIAFSSNRDGNSDIYAMNADGSNQTRLTNNPALDAQPAYSPDGSKIAFTSLRDNDFEVYAMNADGSNQTRLTSNSPSGATDDQPTYSPDGSRMAFRSGRSASFDIYVMNADGTGQTNLTNNPASDNQPKWQTVCTDQADADNDGLGDACDPINDTPGLSYETLHHISFDSPLITLAGFGFDPQNRPAIGWGEASGNGGVNALRWSRRENNAWIENTITQPGGGTRAAQPAFILRQDGTPFFAYAIRDAFIFGQDWYTAHIVDLAAEPTGHGQSVQPIEARQSCIAAYPKFAMDFAPGAISPSFLVGTHCSYDGWLALNNAAIHGAPAFRTPAGTGGEFHSIDYATGPDGSQHVTYFAERGGPDGWGAYYSNGSPGHELRLVVPHRNRRAETSVTVGADGRIHIAIGGAPLCNNTSEGGLLYLTSTDGVNWTRTFIDEVSGRSPSIMLDADGDPHIAYWRYSNEVRYASLEGGQWSTAPVYTATVPVGLTSVKLAFDASNRPHVLFFNPDTSDITIASGLHANLPPVVANPGAQISAAGDSVSLQVAATDAESGALSYNACGLPPGLAIDPGTGLVTGIVTPGTPAGAYEVTVNVTDPAGNTGSTGFVWTVAINTAPAAVDSSATTDEDTSVQIELGASDGDGDALTYAIVADPAHGTIAFLNGMGTYTPAPNFNGADSFTFRANDGTTSSNVATVSLTVTPVNDAPTATGDAATTNEDTSVGINVLANDSDIDGGVLSVQSVAGGAHGTLSIEGGAVVYTPNANFNGPDSFSYTVSDGQGGTSTASVNVTVMPVNDAPAASDGAVSLNEDTQVEITMVGVDIDSAATGFAVMGEPLNGTLSAVVSDRVIYTPNPNFNGTDSFTFIVNDGTAYSNVATVMITVVPVADAPVLATIGNQVIAEGAILSFTLCAVDPDGRDLAFSGTGLPQGAALDPTTGFFSWTPNYQQAGVYMVTFTVTDHTGLSTSEAIAITVNDVEQNLGPVCSAAYPSIGEIWPPNHLRTELVNILGVTDPDGDPLTITVRQILQDEPTNTNGDGNTWIDGGGLGTPQAWVRAERSGTKKVPGNGRVYEIFFDASDGRGKSCTGSVKIVVPHDQGRAGGVVDDGKRYDSTVANGPCLNCNP